MQVSSCLSAFELRAIHLISLIISAQLFEMGNAECCDNKKNPEFKQDKAENLPSLKPVIREVSVNPKPPLIRHDKINSLEPHQSKVYTSEAVANNQLRSEAGKQRDSQLSQGSVQKIKAVESLKEFKTLQASQGPHLTESKVREYEIHQRQSETISVPELNPKVQATLQKYQFFKSQFKCEPRVMLFAGQAYSGEFQEEDERKLPSGYGKLYKSDGSLFLGEFAKGEAHGAGAYVFPDGSFYQGNFLSNLANDQNGFYKALNFEYRGGFRDNLFEGNGVEKTGDYIFEGLYSRGQKASGSLTWGNGCCCYKGPFVQDAFHGKGSLVEPTGTYHGDFNYGVKHGQGEYRFNNGLRYEGDYQNNKRQGRGALYNPTGHTPAYEGDFHDGLPHGEGFVSDEKGNRVASKWVMGIDSASLL